ncbi:MAG TPA: FKBP-type peptidyl-prolyl cis-trans isomerase [Planctomycetes bacterium]|nr:FKBP-type peptidyl-prolyl cis-trans isomerase [Planctomycetota bacterium]
MSPAMINVSHGRPVCLSAVALWVIVNLAGCSYLNQHSPQDIATMNQEEGSKFLSENAQQEGVVSLPSGLQYKVIETGEGDQPGPSDVVKVHYEGRLIDGTVFDSSIERGVPAEFPVNRVIAGWTEALQLMTVGSQWELYIPADLAYGAQGAGGVIGPNATLIFKVELLDIHR